MPRSFLWLPIALLVGVLFGVSTAGGEACDGIDGTACSAGDNMGQDHVDFSVGREEEAVVDVKGEGHVNFSVDGTCGDDKGDSSVNFAVDPDGGFAVEAELLVGPDGGSLELCAGDAGFRIALQPDGAVEMSGEKLAAFDPAVGTRLTVAWSAGAGTAVVAVVDADGALCTGYYSIDFAPETVRVVAAEVRALSIERQ